MILAVHQSLAGFNAAPSEEVERALLSCCTSAQWARLVAAGRPYSSPAELYAEADAATGGLGDAEFDAALAGHPRIGERAGIQHSAGSVGEQSAVSQSSDATLVALAEGNREYEARFGHVYLVCADGRSGEELLRVLRERLGNDPPTERANARAELGKINRLRLSRLIGADG
jgi:2-oxo-4-hydroxy-4-carboxy-5-ureidoimidazoline decarboxylase